MRCPICSKDMELNYDEYLCKRCLVFQNKKPWEKRVSQIIRYIFPLISYVIFVFQLCMINSLTALLETNAIVNKYAMLIFIILSFITTVNCFYDVIIKLQRRF